MELEQSTDRSKWVNPSSYRDEFGEDQKSRLETAIKMLSVDQGAVPFPVSIRETTERA